MAPQQLLPDRRADSHVRETLAEDVQPGTAALAERPFGRSSACVRHRAGDDLARRWASGSGESQQLCSGLPDGHRPQFRRVVGTSHHAASRADRKSSTGWSPDCRRQDEPKPRRLLGGPDNGDRRKRPEEPDSGDRRHGAVETLSAVEQVLREDQGGVYGKMDFSTRDRYRHTVEKIAKSSPRSEPEVACEAIQLAREGAARMGSDDRAAHVGFYLIDKGLEQLERKV